MPTTPMQLQGAERFTATVKSTPMNNKAGAHFYYHSRHGHAMTLMRMAWLCAEDRSKDPVAKIGAVVHHPVTHASFFGYNGFPEGTPNLKVIWDNKNREEGLMCKHTHVLHAEENAINKARDALGDRVKECVLYITRSPCINCVNRFIIPAGIKAVWYAMAHDDLPISEALATVHGISIQHLDLDLTGLS